METKLYEKLDPLDTEVTNKLGMLNGIVIGGFPLDIGTSLAFESIFKPVYVPYDPDRPIPNEIKISDYAVMLINLKTLFRNVFSSLNPDTARIISPSQYAYFIQYEINVIRSLLLNEGANTTVPIFYYAEYKNIYSAKYPEGVRLRKPDTEKQILHNDLSSKTMDLLFKEKDEDMIHFNNEISNTELGLKIKGNVLILTHIPYDLFAYTLYAKLDLVESYTGVLKTRRQWPSKYYGGKDYPNIPFNSKLIKILGDHEMFHPMPIKYRRDLKSFSEIKNWNPLTAPSIVTHDVYHPLGKLDPELVNIYKALK